MKKDLRIHPQSQATSLGHALDDFLLDTQARQLAQATTEFYRTKLRPFIAFCIAWGVNCSGALIGGTQQLSPERSSVLHTLSWRRPLLHSMATALVRGCTSEAISAIASHLNSSPGNRRKLRCRYA